MGGGDAGVVPGCEDVTVGGGEHAGGVIGDDGASDALGRDGHPADFVEGGDVGPAMSRMPLSGAPAATSATMRDVRGGDRLERCARQTDGVAVGGPGHGRVHELYKLRGAHDGVPDRTGLEDVFLEHLGPGDLVQLGHLVHADDREDDDKPTPPFWVAARRLSIDNWKMAGEASSKVGECVRLMTTSAPATASSTTRPLTRSTPVDKECGTAWWPAALRISTTRDPMSPVPPMTANVMVLPASR